MSTSITTTLAFGITIFAAIYGALYLLLYGTHDAREPPAVWSSIPFISSVISLSRKKSRYYTELRERFNLPIYTIRLPGARLYIVNSTSLITQVQRQYKVLAFPPLEAKLAMNVCGSSKSANDVLNTNINGDEGFWGYSITHYKAIQPPLSPGPGLDAMNRAMAQRIAASLGQMQTSKDIRLFDFVKQEITLATTNAVYGPQNPFQDPPVADSFWKFQEGLMGLMMGTLPSIIARDGFKAREFLAKRFITYFKNGGHKEGSALIQARYEHSMEHKIPLEDIARFETAGAIGILTNTSPACFWLVYHLYSSQTALEECRQELSRIVSEEMMTTTDGKVMKAVTLDMSQVKTSCPIMLSTLQEVLRLHSVGISTRLVMEDHMLDGKFLLKKGATVMIPAPVQHKNPSIWGQDVQTFNHRRFLPNEKCHNPIAFRGFGGGTTLCPGRHFASTEILAFAALLILRYEIMPVEGKWKHLTTNKAALWEVTPMPDDDIQVVFTSRAGYDTEINWNILMTASDKVMQLAAEDIDDK